MRLHWVIVDVFMIGPVEHEDLEIDWNRSFDPVVVVHWSLFEHQLWIQQILECDCRPQQADYQCEKKRCSAATGQPIFLLCYWTARHSLKVKSEPLGESQCCKICFYFLTKRKRHSSKQWVTFMCQRAIRDNSRTFISTAAEWINNSQFRCEIKNVYANTIKVS